MPKSEILLTAVQLQEGVEETGDVAAELHEIFRYIKDQRNKNE